MPIRGDITDRVIAAHDRALGSPEYDEKDEGEDEEEGTFSDYDEPELSKEKVWALKQLAAESEGTIILKWLRFDEGGKPL